MVAYGDALKQARRPGWENAYMDYEQFRALLEGGSNSRVVDDAEDNDGEQQEVDDDIPTDHVEDDAYMRHHLFAILLRKEIEKVSFFSLHRLGEIAQAVGALRLQQDLPKLSLLKYPKGQSSTPAERVADGNSTTGKGSSALRPINNQARLVDPYTKWGIELLHLQRFFCINVMGFRKIIKKHQKVLSPQLHHHQQYNNNVIVTQPLFECHFEQLAHSSTAAVNAIHASLVQALSEIIASEEKAADGVVVGTDRIRMGDDRYKQIRLQVTVSSIEVLSQYAQHMNETFRLFLSNKSMITPPDSGLQDDTQQVLQLVLRCQPDAILDIEDAQLEEWSLSNEEMKGRCMGGGGYVLGDQDWGGVNSTSMVINLLSTLLYTVNYYIVAPTANHYAILLGTDGAFGATLVGASSFSAIFAAFLFSWWYTKMSFRSALLFSSACAFLGNLFYALAISYRSMPMAVWGRILVGFGSAESVNRQLISTCVSFPHMTSASAYFVAASAIGMSLGPLLAALLGMYSVRDADVDRNIPFLPSGGLIYNNLTSPGFVTAGLWLLLGLSLVFLFQEPKRINSPQHSSIRNDEKAEDSTLSDKQRKQSSTLDTFGIRYTNYGTVTIGSLSKPLESSDADVEAGLTLPSPSIWAQVKLIKTLVFRNMALPVTLFVFAFIELTDEVLISSCSMVSRRYFGWHGSVAGLIIASLGSFVLPAHFVVERTSHHVEERVIMKYAIIFIILCLVAILNYEGLVFDIIGLSADAIDPDFADRKVRNGTDVEIAIGGHNILKILNHEHEVPYDWGAGQAIYLTFLSAIFMGTIILEGVDTSLMAKASPTALNDTFINCGLLATLVGTLGRVSGDASITFSALVDKNVFTDFLNATFFPMVPLALIGYFLVKRYYGLLL